MQWKERDYLPKVPAKISGGLLGALPRVSFPELVTGVRRRALDTTGQVFQRLLENLAYRHPKEELWAHAM